MCYSLYSRVCSSRHTNTLSIMMITNYGLQINFRVKTRILRNFICRGYSTVPRVDRRVHELRRAQDPYTLRGMPESWAESQAFGYRVLCTESELWRGGQKRFDPGSESNGETDTTAKAVVVSTKVHRQLYGLTDSQGGGTKGLYPKNLQTKKL